MFGVGDSEFFKGAWVKIKPGDSTFDHTASRDNIGQI